MSSRLVASLRLSYQARIAPCWPSGIICEPSERHEGAVQTFTGVHRAWPPDPFRARCRSSRFPEVGDPAGGRKRLSRATGSVFGRMGAEAREEEVPRTVRVMTVRRMALQDWPQFLRSLPGSCSVQPMWEGCE